MHNVAKAQNSIVRGFDGARRQRSVRTERSALRKVGEGSRLGTSARSWQRSAVQFTTQRHAGLHKAAGDGEGAAEEEQGKTRHLRTAGGEILRSMQLEQGRGAEQ